MTLARKARHVRAAKQTRSHECHWPGCGKLVPPAKWGCSKHWFTLPAILRAKLWRAYVIGQEETQTPTREYIKIAREIQDWIAEYVKSNAQSAHSNSNEGARRVEQADDT